MKAAAEPFNDKPAAEEFCFEGGGGGEGEGGGGEGEGGDGGGGGGGEGLAAVAAVSGGAWVDYNDIVGRQGSACQLRCRAAPRCPCAGHCLGRTRSRTVG